MKTAVHVSALSLAGGILICGFLPGDARLLPPGVLLPVCASCVLVMFLSVKGRTLFNTFLAVFFLFLGAYNYLVTVEAASGTLGELVRAERRETLVRGSVLDMPERRVYDDGRERLSFTFAVTGILLDDEEIPVEGRLLLRSFADGRSFAPGDMIVLGGRISAARGAAFPGGFDHARHLGRSGISAVMDHTGGDHYLKYGRQRGLLLRFRRAAHFARRYSDRLLEGWLPGDAYAFGRAILLGERGMITGEVKEVFTRTGTGHMLAVSGLHVGMAGTLFLLLMRLFRLPRRASYALCVLFVFFFVFFTGARVSAMRAGIMFAALLAGAAAKKKPGIFFSLSLAGLMILLAMPGALFSGGFLLSFLAVGSIIVLTPVTDHFILPRRAKHVESGYLAGTVRKALKAFSVSCAVWTGLLPMLACYFGGISFISVFANIVALPWLFLMLVLLMLLVFLAGCGASAVLTGFIASAFEWSYVFLERVLVLFLRIPAGWVSTREIGLPFIASYYVVLVIFLCSFGKARRKRYLAVILALVLANLFIWGAFGRVAPERARLTFFDTGKADAALLELPSGEVCLIDGASARRGHGRRVVGEYLRRQGIRQVDWIFLSHAHEDHIGGLFHIVENFSVGKVIGTGVIPEDPSERALYFRFKRLLGDKGVRYIPVREGSLLTGLADKEFLVFSPLVWKERYEKLNDASLVFRLQYPDGTSVLFCGDAEEEAVRSLLRYSGMLDCDILKVPHHGQKIAEENVLGLFIEMVCPVKAVVLNDAGGRLDETLIDELERVGACLHITGVDGVYVR